MHEMITPTVKVPAISVREMGEGDDKRKAVYIQWNGRSDECELPGDAQFLFESNSLPNSECWCGDPAKFNVVHLGPIRDWPDPEMVQSFADRIANGNPDTDILLVTSSEFTKRDANGHLAPATFISTVILLGDPNCGIIRPRSYTDLTVLDQTNSTVEAKIPEHVKLARKLCEEPRMQLPPEEIPWDIAVEECPKCENFEHSNDRSPAVPPNGDVGDLTHICPHCHRRWWQFNDYYHLWKNVTDPDEWDAIRREDILKRAGFEPPEQ
jgi:hypothetical protein